MFGDKSGCLLLVILPAGSEHETRILHLEKYLVFYVSTKLKYIFSESSHFEPQQTPIHAYTQAHRRRHAHTHPHTRNKSRWNGYCTFLSEDSEESGTLQPQNCRGPKSPWLSPPSFPILITQGPETEVKTKVPETEFSYFLIWVCIEGCKLEEGDRERDIKKSNLKKKSYMNKLLLKTYIMSTDSLLKYS